MSAPIRWADKILATTMAGSDELCIRKPGAAVGSKEQRILKSSFLGGISTSDIAEGSNQYFTNARALSAAEKTNNSVGWTLAGGTTSKSLILTQNCTIDQDLQASASPTFSTATISNSISLQNAGSLTDTKGISLWSGGADYRIGFDDNGVTRGWIRSNVDIVDDNHGWAFTAGAISGSLSASAILQSNSKFILGENAQSITAQAALHVAQDGYFGTNLLTQGTTTSNGVFTAQNGWIAAVFGASASGNRVVSGYLNGVAVIGAHNYALSAWADLYAQPEGLANFAVGLSPVSSQTPNAMLHGARDTILGIPDTALSDASLYNGNIHPWIDESGNILNFKVKYSAGTVKNFPVNTEEAYNYRAVFPIADYIATSADFSILGDTTLGAITVTVSASNIRKEQLVMNYSGANMVVVQPTSGQTINGDTNVIVLFPGQFIRLISNHVTSMYTVGKSNTVRTLTADGAARTTDRIILLDSSSNDVNLTIDVKKLIFPLKAVRISQTGTNVTSFQALSGQTINGVGTAITMASTYTTAQIDYLGGTEGCITGSAVG